MTLAIKLLFTLYAYIVIFMVCIISVTYFYKFMGWSKENNIIDIKGIK